MNNLSLSSFLATSAGGQPASSDNGSIVTSARAVGTLASQQVAQASGTVAPNSGSANRSTSWEEAVDSFTLSGDRGLVGIRQSPQHANAPAPRGNSGDGEHLSVRQQATEKTVVDVSDGVRTDIGDDRARDDWDGFTPTETKESMPCDERSVSVGKQKPQTGAAGNRSILRSLMRREISGCFPRDGIQIGKYIASKDPYLELGMCCGWKLESLISYYKKDFLDRIARLTNKFEEASVLKPVAEGFKKENTRWEEHVIVFDGDIFLQDRFYDAEQIYPTQDPDLLRQASFPFFQQTAYLDLLIPVSLGAVFPLSDAGKFIMANFHMKIMLEFLDSVEDKTQLSLFQTRYYPVPGPKDVKVMEAIRNDPGLNLLLTAGLRHAPELIVSWLSYAQSGEYPRCSARDDDTPREGGLSGPMETKTVPGEAKAQYRDDFPGILLRAVKDLALTGSEHGALFLVKAFLRKIEKECRNVGDKGAFHESSFYKSISDFNFVGFCRYLGVDHGRLNNLSNLYEDIIRAAWLVGWKLPAIQVQDADYSADEDQDIDEADDVEGVEETSDIDDDSEEFEEISDVDEVEDVYEVSDDGSGDEIDGDDGLVFVLGYLIAIAATAKTEGIRQSVANVSDGSGSLNHTTSSQSSLALNHTRSGNPLSLNHTTWDSARRAV